MTDLPIQNTSWLARLSLRRIITSNRFIPEVDGFRFIAILIVIIAHTFIQCGPISHRSLAVQLLQRAVGDGRVGVYLFFTISGFILALPFARHHLQAGNKIDLLSYFRRRLTRLEPPYILAMLLRAPAILLAKHASFAFVGVHLLATLLYVHSLAFGEGSIINPPAWSLEVEIQFYLLAPFLTAIFIIRSKALRRGLIVALMLISGLLASFILPQGGRIALSLPFFFHYFLAGFLLCDFYLCGDTFRLSRWLWDLVGLLSLAWILFADTAWLSSPLYLVVLPFVTLLLYMAGFHGSLVKAFFAFRPVSLIGGMCYSLYLTHATVLTMMTPLVHRLVGLGLPAIAEIPLIFGSTLAAVLLVGTIYFILIERPCMDPSWPNKLAQCLRR